MRIAASVLLVCTFVLLAQETSGVPAAPIAPADEAKLRVISQRARSGEYRALFEAAALPAEAAVPYLRKWASLVDQDTGPIVETARQALRQVPGGAKYVAGEIAEDLARRNMISTYDAETLAMMGTPEAQAALAPYLFDFRIKVEGEVDDDTYTELSPYSTAVWALQRMELPDAPFGERTVALYSTKLVAWQKWAIAKGYVPKEWASRVGAPQWLLDLEARTGGPELEALLRAGAIPNAPTPHALPAAETPGKPAYPTSKAGPVESNESNHWNMRFVIVILIGVVVLASIAWMVFRKNSE